MTSPSAIETDWLKKWALYSPTAIAFKDAESGAEYSYKTIYALSCRLAAHLGERFSIRAGQRVAVLATNELEYLPLFFALQRIGAIMVPINFRLTSREVAHILTDSSPELLIYQEQFQGIADSTGASPKKQWRFDGQDSLVAFLNQCLKEEQAAPAVAMHENAFEAACMILYTSGTTGAPKGALITNKMLFWNSINTSLSLGLTQNDVNLGFLPFFHTGGWNVLLTPFVHRGARTVLMRKFDAAKVLELCEKERVTILFGVPTTMDMMARTPQFSSFDLSSVRFAIVGGEPMPLDLIKTWQKKGISVRQGYGLTEFGPNVFSLAAEDSLRKIGSIGFSNFYIETRIVDGSGNDLPAGEVGELLLRGPACTPGYWNNEQATDETIRHGWLHTGDLVRKDADGYFFVAGRKKDMFISGGENVYPVEVERFLSAHPAIREVAVVGVPDARWGEVGKAFVALNSGQSLGADDVIAYCVAGLAKYKIPKQIEFLPELPKGDSGKILKRLLP